MKKWNRIGASVIDNSIIVVLIYVSNIFIMLLFGNILVIKSGGSPFALIHDLIILVLFLMFNVFVAVGYNMLMFNRFKRTLGQILLRVHIVDEKSGEKLIEVTKKQLFKREMYKWTLIIATFYLYGFFCLFKILFNQEVYHNKVAKTKVEVWV